MVQKHSHYSYYKRKEGGVCLNCGKTFMKRAHNQKFCSEKCKREYNNRIARKRARERYLSSNEKIKGRLGERRIYF